MARVIGHEVIGHHGLRAVFGEKFDEFLDGVYRDHFEEIQKLSKVYNRDTETVENQRYLTEEFLANCANAEKKPSWWKEFLGKIRQGLRKIFPNLHFTDRDIEAALSRSARAMRRKGVLAQQNGKSAQGNGVRFAIGDKVKQIIDNVPIEDTNVALLSRSSDAEDVVKKVFESFPRTVIAADGKNILLQNPQILFDKTTGQEIVESEEKRMQNRLDHLTRGGEDHNSSSLDNRKFKWLPRTPETLQKAQIKLQADRCLGYVRRYKEGFHLVLVSPDGVAYYETGIDNALVSQFKENFTGKKGDFVVVWESGRFADSTTSRLPVADQGGAPLPATDQHNIPSSGEKSSGVGQVGQVGQVETTAAEDIRKTDVSKSDVSDRSETDGHGSAPTDTDGAEGNTRFSIDDGGLVEPKPFESGIDDARGKNIVAMLRPIVGMTQVGFDKEALARNLKERYGVDVSPAEALLWAREASRQNFVEHRKRQNKIRDEWLYENNLLWKQAVDYAGSENFKVRVSDRMNDRELSGTFWLKPGEKYSGTVVDLDALANEVALSVKQKSKRLFLQLLGF